LRNGFDCCIGKCRYGDDFKLLGVGAVISASPYRGVGRKIQPVPVAVWDYKEFM
jgi:hypothetical protein